MGRRHRRRGMDLRPGGTYRFRTAYGVVEGESASRRSAPSDVPGPPADARVELVERPADADARSRSGGTASGVEAGREDRALDALPSGSRVAAVGRGLGAAARRARRRALGAASGLRVGGFRCHAAVTRVSCAVGPASVRVGVRPPRRCARRRHASHRAARSSDPAGDARSRTSRRRRGRPFAERLDAQLRRLRAKLAAVGLRRRPRPRSASSFRACAQQLVRSPGSAVNGSAVCMSRSGVAPGHESGRARLDSARDEPGALHRGARSGRGRARRSGRRSRSRLRHARRSRPARSSSASAGSSADGHAFAPTAAAAGAVALVVERAARRRPAAARRAATCGAAMPAAATLFFGDPTRELEVAGVTGTNGKTTTAFLLHAILDAARPPARACSRTSSAASAARRGRPGSTRRRRSTCSGSSARCSTPATARA